MPPVALIFYRDDDGSVPVVEWLDALGRRDERIQAKCRERIRELADMGYELRRPQADLLRDGIYELRLRFARVNYRLLYFFHERAAVVLAHGLTKENGVQRGILNWRSAGERVS